MKPSISPRLQQRRNRRALRRVVEAHAGRQLDRQLLRPARLLDAAADPVNVGGLDAEIVVEQGARPHIGGELIFRHADFAALQVGRLLYPIGAHVNRGVPEGPRDESRDRDIGTIALRRFQGEARQRQFADVEFGAAERTKENLFGAERHEDRVDAVDGDAAVNQRAGAVIVADGDREIELGHSNFPYPTGVIASRTR